MWMSGLNIVVEGRNMVAVTHLADIARSQNTRAAFWDKSCIAGLFSVIGIMKDKFKKLIEQGRGLFDKLSVLQLDVYSSGATFFIFISIIPFIMIILYIISHTALTQPDLLVFLKNYIPNDYEILLEAVLNNIFNKSKVILPLSIVVCVWSSSRGIMAITKGLNKINCVDETRNYFVVRLISSAYTILLVAGVVILMTLGAFGKKIFNILTKEFSNLHNSIPMLFNNSDFILFIIIFLMFMFMYKFLPSKHMTFLKQIPGALSASLIWIIFTRLFSYYINNYNAYSIYGSLAFIIVFVLWIYAGIYFMFIGAWINYRIGLR